MTSRNLTKRLQRPEEQKLPSRETDLVRGVYANGPDGAAVGGLTPLALGHGSQSPKAENRGSGSQAEWGICLKP